MLQKTGALIASSLLATLLATSTVAHAAINNSAMSTQSAAFQQCVDNIEQKALAEGVSKKTIHDALGSVEFIERTIELDRRQPEFNETLGNYLNKRISTTRIEQGRKLLKDYQPLLNQLTKEYGIPQHVLIAFWGLETNYGSYLGKFPVVDTLLTLACDHRRSSYFTNETVTALKLMEKHDISHEQMLGSWAGAMGHTQFMPSAYLQYGIDGDKSGHVNLWKSIPDALTSAANFLNNLGWQRSWKWGREVSLPATFDYSIAGLKNKKSLAEWRKLGITTVYGSLVPAEDIEAELIIPAGYQGPAFLVYDNFHVIMGWNRSVYYALAVGHLADRLNGAPEFHQPPPANQPRLNTAQIKALQAKLNDLGFDSGKPDGIVGPATRKAIRDYQYQQKMVADGYPRQKVFDALNIALVQPE